jgi:hypothetical protein
MHVRPSPNVVLQLWLSLWHALKEIEALPH